MKGVKRRSKATCTQRSHLGEIAVFSADLKHRFYLERNLFERRGVNELEDEERVLALPLAFIMLNPSTADAFDDDPTIRKCQEFAWRFGYGHVRILNLFSFRATDPKNLWKLDDDLRNHRLNDEFICEVVSEGADVVYAWGAFDKARERAMYVDAMLNRFGERSLPMVLGYDKKKTHPRHPLMMPYTSMRKKWHGYKEAA